MQRVLQLVFKFSSSKMLEWNHLNSKFLKKSLRMLWFCLGKKSQEDGSYKIMSVLPLALARPYQEPQPCREQQQREKAHFEHFKTQEDMQLDTGKEHTFFFCLATSNPSTCSPLCAYFHIPLWSEEAMLL